MDVGLYNGAPHRAVTATVAVPSPTRRLIYKSVVPPPPHASSSYSSSAATRPGAAAAATRNGAAAERADAVPSRPVVPARKHINANDVRDDDDGANDDDDDAESTGSSISLLEGTQRSPPRIWNRSQHHEQQRYDQQRGLVEEEVEEERSSASLHAHHHQGSYQKNTSGAVSTSASDNHTRRAPPPPPPPPSSSHPPPVSRGADRRGGGVGDECDDEGSDGDAGGRHHTYFQRQQQLPRQHNPSHPGGSGGSPWARVGAGAGAAAPASSSSSSPAAPAPLSQQSLFLSSRPPPPPDGSLVQTPRSHHHHHSNQNSRNDSSSGGGDGASQQQQHQQHQQQQHHPPSHSSMSAHDHTVLVVADYLRRYYGQDPQFEASVSGADAATTTSQTGSGINANVPLHRDVLQHLLPFSNKNTTKANDDSTLDGPMLRGALSLSADDALALAQCFYLDLYRCLRELHLQGGEGNQSGGVLHHHADGGGGEDAAEALYVQRSFLWEPQPQHVGVAIGRAFDDQAPAAGPVVDGSHRGASGPPPPPLSAASAGAAGTAPFASPSPAVAAPATAKAARSAVTPPPPPPPLMFEANNTYASSSSTSPSTVQHTAAVSRWQQRHAPAPFTGSSVEGLTQIQPPNTTYTTNTNHYYSPPLNQSVESSREGGDQYGPSTATTRVLDVSTSDLSRPPIGRPPLSTSPRHSPLQHHQQRQPTSSSPAGSAGRTVSGGGGGPFPRTFRALPPPNPGATAGQFYHQQQPQHHQQHQQYGSDTFAPRPVVSAPGSRSHSVEGAVSTNSASARNNNSSVGFSRQQQQQHQQLLQQPPPPPFHRQDEQLPPVSQQQAGVRYDDGDGADADTRDAVDVKEDDMDVFAVAARRFGILPLPFSVSMPLLYRGTYFGKFPFHGSGGGGVMGFMGFGSGSGGSRKKQRRFVALRDLPFTVTGGGGATTVAIPHLLWAVSPQEVDMTAGKILAKHQQQLEKDKQARGASSAGNRNGFASSSSFAAGDDNVSGYHKPLLDGRTTGIPMIHLLSIQLESSSTSLQDKSQKKDHKQKQRASSPLAFSLVFPERTVDLEAESAADFKAWLGGLLSILRRNTNMDTS